MGEDGRSHYIAVAVDSINAINHRDSQAAVQGCVLELVDHLRPSCRRVSLGRAAAAAEDAADSKGTDILKGEAVLFDQGHLADLFFEAHLLDKIFDAVFNWRIRVQVDRIRRERR